MNLTAYRQYRAKLFPLRKCVISDADSKRPLIKAWPDADYSDEQLTAYPGHGVAWALGKTDLVIDVDAPTPERPGKKGLASLAALERQLGFKLSEVTSCVESPSGGRHYYFTKPSDVSTVKSVADFPDIEFLTHGCYVVVAGSPP